MSERRAKPSKKPHPKLMFTVEEDRRLRYLVQFGNITSWEVLARHMPGRNARQCKDRWCYYLSPDIKNTPWTDEEDRLLIEKRKELGPKWVRISKFFPNRTDVNIKNRWSVLERRRVSQMKINARSRVNDKKEVLSQLDQGGEKPKVSNDNGGVLECASTSLDDMFLWCDDVCSIFDAPVIL